jgi:hypothetical protein
LEITLNGTIARKNFLGRRDGQASPVGFVCAADRKLDRSQPLVILGQSFLSVIGRGSFMMGRALSVEGIRQRVASCRSKVRRSSTNGIGPRIKISEHTAADPVSTAA